MRTTILCIVLLALFASTQALDTRERSGLENKLDGDENSQSSSTTVNKKLGFAFVLDNGNDIENVERSHAARHIVAKNRKQGAVEAAQKQQARDAEYKNYLEKIQKDQQELSTLSAANEEKRKQTSEQAQKKGDEASEEEKQKRKAEFDRLEKLQSEESGAAEQRRKAEEKKAEESAAAEAAARESKNKGIVREKNWKVERGAILQSASDISFTGSYAYMFWVKPLGTIGGWGNILHKGQENVNRNPAIWFYPGQTRLHCRSGTAANPSWENGGNNGCDPDRQLPVNEWTHVALVHNSWGLRVYLNGNIGCETGIGAPVSNSGALYVSDPWHDVANAQLADFRVLTRVASLEEIQKAVSDKRGL